MKVSVVSPVEDFEDDPRICLTSIHFPSESLKSRIEEEITNPLRQISPEYYFYSKNSLHITVKNIRVINDPPHFTEEDIKKAEEVFSKVVPTHKKFKIYYFGLLLFPNNLALIGTTDEELDKIILDLDKKLKGVGVSDDKQYINSRYFFSNVTLARFSKPVSKKFIMKVNELSEKINIDPYIVDSVSLITGTAVLKRLRVIKTWILRGKQWLNLLPQ